MLSITKEEFLEIYHGLPICDNVDLFYSIPKDEKELFSKYFKSKLWRLNNIYTIVDKAGKRRRFRMNKSQHKVYAAALRHPRLIILKSRQQGISTLWLIAFFDDALIFKDFSIGLMAQGQDEAEMLLERTKLLWETLHQDYKQFLNIQLRKNNSKEFSLSNGSTIFIRTSFRSATLQRLHISEMGKIANKYPDKAHETKTGTLQALAKGNIGVIESTAEGDNLFKDMWDNAIMYTENRTLKDFFPVFLSWVDDPDCVIEQDQPSTRKQEEYFAKVEKELGKKLTQHQKNFWLVQYRELTEKIYQEYPSTPTEAFMATKQGAYYAQLYMEWVKTFNREKPKLYDKNLDVQISVDLGMNDTNVLTVFQVYGDEFRYIDEFYDNGQQIKYYTDWIKTRPWYSNLTHVILPPDAEVRELTSGKTRTEVFEEELSKHDDGTPTNILFTLLPKSDVNEGIEQVRQVVVNMWIDPGLCPYLISCFINYKKEWDYKREKFRDKPDHDEYSNGADSIRYSAVGAIRGKYQKRPKESSAGQKQRIIAGLSHGHDV